MGMWLNEKEIPEDTGFWDIIRQSGPEYQPCILCGEDTRDWGYLKPENPQQFGAPGRENQDHFLSCVLTMLEYRRGF